MTPFEAYVLYCALKQHFTSASYDFNKYHGKVKLSIESFEKRGDRFFYAKLAKRKDLKEYLISNFIATGPKIWVGDLVNSVDAETIFMNWKKRTQSLSYYFEEDLKNCLTNLDENLIIRDNQHPHLLKLFLRKKISLETLIILNELLGFFKHWNKKLSDDIIWKDVYIICEKYRPFMLYDINKMKKIALNIFEPA
jgi:hypothetical protein